MPMRSEDSSVFGTKSSGRSKKYLLQEIISCPWGLNPAIGNCVVKEDKRFIPGDRPLKYDTLSRI